MEQGPLVYENWKRHERGDSVEVTFEHPLWTDAYVVSEISHLPGPYKLLNGLAFTQAPILKPAILLRVETFSHDEKPLEEWKTDSSRYHAGYLADEIAALVSLCLGIRVWAGTAARWFFPSEDPKGRPTGWNPNAIPTLLKPTERKPVLASALLQGNLSASERFFELMKLTPSQATALTLSSRSYQAALWNAESDVETSWLQMVTAVETAAVYWSGADREDPVEKLKVSKPQIFDDLSGCGEQILEKVAAQIVPFMGATSKFIKFLVEFGPDAPTQRPEEAFQLEWTQRNLKKAYGQIYGYRSEALHSGKPFPLPMCEPPSYVNNEVPLGLAMAGKGGTWMNEDIPMLFHVFEHIARGALLNWWTSMIVPRN